MRQIQRKSRCKLSKYQDYFVFMSFINKKNMSYYISENDLCEERGADRLQLKTDNKFVLNFLDVIGYDTDLPIIYLYRTWNKNNIIFANMKSVSHAYFSKENIKLYKKKNNLYNEKFLNKIELLSDFLKREEINKSNIVIANGMALEAYGIRKSGDIDIVIAPSERRKWNTSERVELTDFIEIKRQNDYDINDIDIVLTDKNHVVVRGFKFMSIKLCFLHSLQLVRKRHNRNDVKLIIKYMIKGLG